MIGTLFPFVIAAALGGTAHSLLRASRDATRSRRAATSRRRIPPEEARALVAEFGGSANSFMTLYPGFERFAHPDPAVRGMIAFVEGTGAWVGGAEPFCAPGDRESLLDAFAEGAAALGKAAIILPVDGEHAQAARAAGYHAVMIGTEPTFDLARYPRAGRSWNDLVPTARLLAGKGARVTPFDPAELAPADREELDRITAEWLGTRKMAALGFLNQVDPWFGRSEKRYFKIAQGGRIWAFLAAVPFRAGQGWYLADLIRRSDSPAGSTELLLLQAMRLLREAGAQVATMGVAPLSGLEHAPRGRLHRLLRLVYERGNAFYSFKSLHRYKLKFDPSSHPAVFLVYRGTGRDTAKLGPRALRSLAAAFLPAGVARATGTATLRILARASLTRWLRAQLRPDFVARSSPPTWPRLLARCKLTTGLIAASLAAYAWTTDNEGRIQAGIASEWAFSWSALVSRPLHALALSPFLHWNALHLSLNLVGLFAFVGGFELLVGTGIAATAFLAPALFANPLTAAIIHAAGASSHELDIGISLGIFGCAGALCLLLRWGPWLAACLVLAILVDGGARGSWLTLGHCVALGAGAAIGRATLRG